VVIGGLILVWLGKNALPRYGALLQKADAVAAFGVALIVLFVSYRLGKRTIDVLLDRAPDGLAAQIRETSASVDGVLSVGQVRVRRSGPSLFVDLTVDVDRNQSFERTHHIAEAVEDRIREIAPGADVVVHTDPREVERETMARRIRAVAYRNQMFVHNISLHEEGGRVHVDLHLEVDDHLSLQQAHDLATHFEQDLRADAAEIADVTTHLESRGTGIGDGADVTADEPALVARIVALTDAIVGGPSCHDVTVRRHGSAISVALHCAFARELSIVEVHDASTRIEVALKEKIPGLDRVLVHAEPGDL
jgi:divalent metal cation (Fe/Co/Zn/Cd) transporter